MAPIVAQGPLFFVLFSTIGGCILVIIVYMAIAVFFERRKDQGIQPHSVREPNPLAWKARPDPLTQQ